MANTYYEDLLERMQACVDSGDPEDAHGTADDLLIEICKAAVRQLLTEEQVNILIELYCKVPKWYA